MHITQKTLLATVVAGLTMTGCSQMQMGDASAKTEATGAAAGSTTQNANSKLERCEKPLGTIGIEENQTSEWYTYLSHDLKLSSTVPVLKLIVQQSNCFMVVERGRAMKSVMKERELNASGELRGGSNYGKGQIVAADYTLSPSITFSNNDAGGVGAAIGGLFGSVGAAIGGSLKFKEASTVLTLIDNRSSIQVSASEGSAKNMDFGAVGGILGGGLGAVGGGYSNTSEGKVIVAAFVDAYNNMVRAVREYKPQTIQGGPGKGGALKVQGGDEAAKTSSSDNSGKKAGKKK